MHAREENERDDLKFYSLLLSLSRSLLLCVRRKKKSERISILPSTYIHIPEISLSVRYAPSSTSIDVRKKNNTKKKQRHLIDGSSDRRDKKVCCIYSCI